MSRTKVLLSSLLLVVLACNTVYAYDIFFAVTRPYGPQPDVVCARAMPTGGEQVTGWELWIGHWSEDTGQPMKYYRIAWGSTALDTTIWEINTTRFPYSVFLSQGAKYGYTFIVYGSGGYTATCYSGMLVRP